MKAKCQAHSIRTKIQRTTEDQVSPTLDSFEVDKKESSGNEPLVIDLPNKSQVEAPKLFYVDCWFGTECVPTMVDTWATTNFINEDLAKRLKLKATSVRDPITCQFSNGAFDFCTTKVSRQEIRFIG